MRKLLIVCSTFFISFFAKAQNDIVVKPGIGIGKLKLGMTKKQVEDLMKTEITWTDYKQEMVNFIGFETRVDSILQFVIGFDECGTFEQAPETIPVYGIYFKNGKLNFISVSSYTGTAETVAAVKLPNGIGFYTPTAKCKETMGADYVSVNYSDYDGDHYYHKQGVEFVYDEGKLTAIGIFAPVPDYKEKIAARSAELLKQVAAIKNEGN